MHLNIEILQILSLSKYVICLHRNTSQTKIVSRTFQLALRPALLPLASGGVYFSKHKENFLNILN